MYSYFVMWLLLLSCLFAEAQESRSVDWLRNNDRGNRYEGTYDEEIGNPSVELVSFWAAFEPYEFGRNQQLKIGFPSPAATDYFLKAEELRVEEFYWMQNKEENARNGWNEFGPWPIDEWLQRLNIKRQNLGILIELEAPGSRKLSPAYIYHSQPKPAASMYVAIVRLGEPVAEGTCVVYQGLFESTRPDPNKIIMEKAVGKRSADSHFPLLFPWVQLAGSPGWYTVHLRLRKQNSTREIPYSFYFYHSGRTP